MSQCVLCFVEKAVTSFEKQSRIDFQLIDKQLIIKSV